MWIFVDWYLKLSIVKWLKGKNLQEVMDSNHRLRHIDTHLAYVCTMPYTYSGKNSYAEPVLNKTKQISKIRD